MKRISISWPLAGLLLCVGVISIGCRPSFTSNVTDRLPSATPKATTGASLTPKPEISATLSAPQTQQPGKPTVAPETVSLPPGVLATYNRSGCFAGVNETLTIHLDGTLEFTTRQGQHSTGQANSRDLQALQRLLNDPAFAGLQPAYQAMGADLCVYTIVALVDNQTRQVVTMDGASTPPFLQKVMGRLGQFVTAAR